MSDTISSRQTALVESRTGFSISLNELGAVLSCRSSPVPFKISLEEVDWFRRLGDCLLSFYKAQNALYMASVAGQAPSWVSQYLDNGKPDHIVELGRAKAFKDEVPPIMRPDVLPVHGGFSICELDSVPGGFGLAARMVDYYTRLGHRPVGDITIEEGFVRAMAAPRRGQNTSIAIVVSDESVDYLSEMKWLAGKLGGMGYATYVAHPRDLCYTENGVSVKVGGCDIAIDTVYRFMELFDFRNISKWELLTFLAKGRRVRLAPTPKSFLEEKLWFALFHHPALNSYWEGALGAECRIMLEEVIPATWILDPTPIPPHAVIPGLSTEQGPAQSWDRIQKASKRGRQMVIKPSGFSPAAWGSRGVVVGHDVCSADWSRAIEKALSAFPDTTYVLQEYKRPVRMTLPVFADGFRRIENFVGRVRLSPYYFIEGGHARLSAILATACPSDKKVIHGMRDAVMTVCAV